MKICKFILAMGFTEKLTGNDISLITVTLGLPGEI